MDRHTTRVPARHCPVCSTLLDAATDVEEQGNKPKPDDLTICIGCGTFLLFDKNLKLYKPDKTDEELLAELPGQQRLLMMQMKAAVFLLGLRRKPTKH